MESLEALLDQLAFTRDNRGYGGSKTKMNAAGERPMTMLFGKTKYIMKQTIDWSVATKQHPKVYEALKRVAVEHFPDFHFGIIQVNKNFQTLRHLDALNRGDSVIFSLGDFTGGKLGTDDELITTYKKPYRFNGSKTYHWTEPFEGTRYAVIYFSNDTTSITDQLECESKADFATVKEIFHRKIYGTPERGERWLDIGGNIGTFALWCRTNGASCISYEPEPRNFHKLEKVADGMCFQMAVSNYSGKAQLYLERNNTWRHTLHKVRGRESIEVDVIDALDLPECDGIKIDAEGAEIDIIYRLRVFPNKLVVEYDGGHHPLTADYYKFIDYLKQHYDVVKYRNVKGDRINFFPNGLIISCH